MSKIKQKKIRWHSRKPLLATALTVAGVLSTVSAVVAEGTPAGTPITNTATATYNDGNGTSINATSNTVTINVAEIAGITAVPNGFLDVNGGAIEGTDTLVYSFLVTNTGNDETDVFIPGTANIITSRFDVSAGAGGKVEIYAANGTTLLGTVPALGGNYTAIVAGGATVPADGQFVVKVTGKIAAVTTANQPVGVTLGNTPPNNNTPATQNQSFTDNGATNDLRTVNVGPILPTNGDREASASQSKPFASANNPLALATVLKLSSVDNKSATSATDDLITYDLGLRVESVVPPGSTFQAAPLEGTTIRLNGSDQTRILIADAVPVGTVLQSVSTPPSGSGWTPVYSTVVAANSNPLATTTTWSTTAPADLSTVTRVGFVHLGPLAPGFSIAGLKFTVVTSGLVSPPGTVNNIAQVFGETVDDPTNKIVYDESGDQSPNNFEGATPGADYPAGGIDGVADPAANGVDPGGNTGTGPNGEVNQVTILLATDDILTGPAGQPGAIGPNNDNDDFTNKSTAVPPNIGPTDTFTPGLVVFNNSLTNPATSGFLANVTLQPIAPTVADTATSTTGQYGGNGDIPNGTVVTIKFLGKTDAVYTYNSATGFTLTAGTPINVGSVAPNQAVNYTVEVQLPATSPLRSVAIPIVAFPDDLSGPPGFNNETTNNVTINRVYTGFMSLVKKARVLNANGDPLTAFTDVFAAAQAILPGEFIEYQIEYANISTPPAGSNNVTLSANNFVITEDGTATGGNTAAGGNNWAGFTTHQQNTQFRAGSIVAYTDLTGPTVFSDPASGTKVDKYVNTIGTVLPGPTNGGFLIFRRRVN